MAEPTVEPITTNINNLSDAEVYRVRCGEWVADVYITRAQLWRTHVDPRWYWFERTSRRLALFDRLVREDRDF